MPALAGFYLERFPDIHVSSTKCSLIRNYTSAANSTDRFLPVDIAQSPARGQQRILKDP